MQAKVFNPRKEEIISHKKMSQGKVCLQKMNP